MTDVHVYAPPPTEESYRLLKKWRRTFESEKFDSWEAAVRDGLERWGGGFRVFHQYTYEWHEPLNVELVRIADAMLQERKR